MKDNKLYIPLNIQRFSTHLRTWGTYYFGTGTGTYNGRYDGNGRVKVYLESQSSSNNSSYIRIEHFIVLKTTETQGGMEAYSITSSYRANQGSQGGSYQSKTGSKSTPMYPVYAREYEYSLGSTYHTVYHNSDGSGTLYVNGSIKATLREKNAGNSFTATRASSFSASLPTIPRYTSITSYTRSNITLTSFRVNWASAHTVDRVEYRINSGAWTLGQSGDRSSGNFTVSGRNPNTTYQVQIRVRRKDSGLWASSSNVNVKTLNIATFNSVPNNINLENPFTITFNRNGASNTNLGVYATGSIPMAAYRLVTGTSYTFELTEEEKNTFFTDMSTVNSKSYAVYLNTNDNDYRTTVSRTFVITNANPIFNNFDYEDINPLTLDLTGDNQTIIKGYSNLKATITQANKMEAIKGANPKEYQLVVGSKQIKKNYHETEDVELTLNAIENNVFIVYAIDSRSNSTQKQISPANYIDYFKPTIGELTVNRENNISTYTNLSFSGTFFNANFGAENNTLTATYEYLNTKTEEWKAGDTPLNLTITDNNFSFDGLIAGDLDALGFDISESFEIRVKVEDMLTDESRAETLVSAKPNIALHDEGTALNNQFDETLGNGVQLNGDGVYYNGLLLFGWGGALPISAKEENLETEELKELETTEVVEIEELEEEEDEKTIDSNVKNI